MIRRGCLCLLLVLGCASPFEARRGELPEVDCEGAAERTRSVYLIGDAGEPDLPPEDGDGTPVDPVLAELRRDVDASVAALGRERVDVVYLGDNVYQKGLVPEGHRDRRRGERILEAQIAAAGEAGALFTAGNHDWDMSGPRGWDHILAQREFLAQQGPRVRMLPAGGCIGPERVDRGRYLRLVFLDPMGWGHLARDPEAHVAACPEETTALDSYHRLADEFAHPDGRHVVLATHHPLLTAGPHGGNYGLRQHLFPLTDFWSWAWLPLPVVGSVYPLSRQLGVTETDITNAAYRRYMLTVYRAATARAPMLVAAGHEHSLQVHRDEVGMYHAVSGAGSVTKVNRVDTSYPTVLMAEAEPGFMRLDVHDDGALGLTVYAVPAVELPPLPGDLFESKPPAEPIYRACLAHGPPRGRLGAPPADG